MRPFFFSLLLLLFLAFKIGFLFFFSSLPSFRRSNLFQKRVAASTKASHGSQCFSTKLTSVRLNEARTLWSEKEKCLAEVTARQDTKPGGRRGWRVGGWVGAGGGAGGRKASWYYLNSCCVHFPRTERDWLGKWDIKAVNLANKAALTSTINVTQRRQRLSVPGVFPPRPPPPASCSRKRR